MAKPIALQKDIAFAFPDVCLTPVPSSSPVPIPYPNIADLGSAEDVSEASGKELLVAGTPVLLLGSTVDSTSGAEAGTDGGVSEGQGPGKKCEVTQASESVLWGPDGKGIARFGDTTEHNDGNAIGMILSAEPSVLVGD